MRTKTGMFSWDQSTICREFGMDSRTVSKRLVDSKLHKRKSLTTKEVFTAVLGDFGEQRLRKETLAADLLEIEKHQSLNEWVPVSAVDRVWSGIAAEMVQKISQLEISQDKKEELCESLQAIPLDEYLSSTNKVSEEDGGEVSPAAQA